MKYQAEKQNGTREITLVLGGTGRTGRRTLTCAAVAREISFTAGREIRFNQIPGKAFARAAAGTWKVAA